MRGYFGIGALEISKEANVGAIVRTAHAFGASFFFTIAPSVDVHKMKASDTSDAFDHLPYFQYKTPTDMELPKGCQLVGVEFVDESIPLPQFRHPVRAAYIFGPEMGSLTPEILERCDHVVKIPMKFCVNVGVAAALVMYDRMISMGKFAERPVRAGGSTELPDTHVASHRRFSRKKK